MKIASASNRYVFGLGALALASAAAVIACGSALDSSFASGDGGTSPDASIGPPSEAGTPPFADAATGTVIEANAIVLVHAASFPAFRVCFDGAMNEVPMPNADLLPDSNVLGVDVGTAIRLPPTSVHLGRAFVFPEPILRPLYPAFGGSGPTCGQLLGAQGTNKYAVDVGEVTEDLSTGVHALVLSGCRSAGDDPAAAVDRCGGTWTAQSGNLRLSTLRLVAYASAGTTSLSVQLLQLSPALDSLARGRALGLAFGAVDASAPAPFVEGQVPLGMPVPSPPALVQYDSTDLSAYATSAVFLTLGGAVDDGGAPFDAGPDASRNVLLSQSLADIQKRSSPRSVPSDWFGVASSYVLLSLGDPDPRLGDGGKDDDVRRALHLLAIPLAAADAGDVSPASP